MVRVINITEDFENDDFEDEFETEFDEEDSEPQYDRPSKSQRKRDMIALQKLGETIVNQSKERVRKVPMPDDVRDAIEECQRLKGHEARRRQMQFIGKKMRKLDEEQIAAMKRVVDGWQGASKAETVELHRLERLRERLLADNGVLTEVVEQYQEVDVSRLRTLIRNARKEQEQSKPPKAYREIFRVLKALKPRTSPSGDEDEQSEDAS